VTQFSYVIPQPAGMAGPITPWNTPFLLETWKLAAAPASGCTGETTTGQTIMAAAAPHLEGLSMELGGKSPCVIFADADLDRAIDSAPRCSGPAQTGQRRYAMTAVGAWRWSAGE
jgi:acyl-CoA reductase-like NAD-dependent aldehyde dehydrogenase